MTTQQQTERERLADDLEKICAGEWVEGADAKFRRIAALLRGDEPAKPDRYMTTAYEVWNTYTNEGPGAAAAVLRKHFEPSAEAKAMLETFSADVIDAQSRYVIVHQLRASADIQDRETKRKTGWADTNDRACLMRSAADAIEVLADFILKGHQ